MCTNIRVELANWRLNKSYDKYSNVEPFSIAVKFPSVTHVYLSRYVSENVATALTSDLNAMSVGFFVVQEAPNAFVNGVNPANARVHESMRVRR